jgi:hypothetical protein
MDPEVRRPSPATGDTVQILFVGQPLFSPLHLTQPHYCLPSTV